MTDKMIAVPMELLEELRDCADLCADDVRAHDLGEDSAEAHFRQVGRACDALLSEAALQSQNDISKLVKRLREADKPLLQQKTFSGVRALLREAAEALQSQDREEQQPAPGVARLVHALGDIANIPIDPCSTKNDYRLSAAKAIANVALANYHKGDQP